MDFFIDLARYLAVVMLELIVLFAAGWLCCRQRCTESSDIPNKGLDARRR